MRSAKRALPVVALTLGALGAALGTAQAAPVHQQVLSHPRIDAVTLPAQAVSHFSHLLNARRQALAATQTSSNWSGYAANGGTYTTVTSSWTEPAVSCTADGIVAFWIGLDGWGSTSVEQDGTGVDCSSGSPQAFAWWETYPANSIQQYDEPVQTGDRLTSTVTSESNGKYDLVLTDSTQGWTENNVVAKPSGAENASAEVIAEAVSSNSGVTPLPDFGSVQFTGSTIDNGSLQASGAQPIDMINSSNTVIAATSTADSSGDFAVDYGSGTTTTGNTVTVNAPADQSSAVGAAADLQVSGTDSGGATLAYSATGLPPGAGINKSGLITGTLTTAGTYDVTVTATDSTGATGSASFTWTEGGSTPPPPGCNGLAAWSAGASYVPGDKVSYAGDAWTSTWYSTGATPGAPGSWAVWQNDGAC